MTRRESKSVFVQGIKVANNVIALRVSKKQTTDIPNPIYEGYVHILLPNKETTPIFTFKIQAKNVNDLKAKLLIEYNKYIKIKKTAQLYFFHLENIKANLGKINIDNFNYDRDKKDFESILNLYKRLEKNLANIIKKEIQSEMKKNIESEIKYLLLKIEKLL